MSLPRKIVFVGLTDYTNAPTRIRCYNFARILKDRGWEAEVFSFQDDLAAPEHRGQEMSVMLHLPEEERERLIREAIPRLEALGPALFVLQKVHWHAAALVKVCRERGWPYLLDYDDDDRGRTFLFEDEARCRHWFGAFGQVNVLSAVAAGAVAGLAASRKLAELLGQWTPQVHLVETGVDIDKFYFADRRGRTSNHLVWLGQLWGERMVECLDLACRAARRVHREGVDFHFHVIGRGMEEELPKRLDLRYPGLPITYDGWVHPDKAPEVLASMDVAFFPLAPAWWDYEWMRSKSPTKLFEYMASGLPAVATRLGEAERIVTDGDTAFLASTEAEMADKLHLLLTDRELRWGMGERARAMVERDYSLAAMGDKLAAALDAVWRGLAG